MPVSAKTYRAGEEEYKVAPNFRAGEFNTGNEEFWVVADPLTSVLQKIRDAVGKPLRITSGFRSTAYNAKIGGASRSRHTGGLAADIATGTGVTWQQIAGAAYAFGIRRIGVASSFVHIDVDSGQGRWNYGRSSPPVPTIEQLEALAEPYLK